MITEHDFLDFECPYCGEAVSFPGDIGGHLEACPTCAESLIVPAESGLPGLKIPIPVTTPRLSMRRFAAGDWKDLLTLMSDEELFQYTDISTLDEAGVLAWLERDRYVRLTSPNQVFYLGLELLDSQRLAGFASLHFTDPERRTANFSVLVERPLQRQGLGTEAAHALLRFCFGGIRLHRVVARCDSRNQGALTMLGRLGMRREAEFVKDRFLGDQWANTLWYGMLAEEYQPAPGNPTA